MDDLISRKTLKEAFCADVTNTMQTWNTDLLQLLMLEIEEAPAVEAEPVRHGEWEWYEEERNSMFPDGDYGWRCSVCKQDLASELALGVPGLQYVHEILDDPDKPPTLKRCLFCSAKMDGGL